MAGVSSDTGIKLEVGRCYAYTNIYGIATFALVFTAGMPGTYTLVFEMGKTKSAATEDITLVNTIQKVTVHNTSKQTFVKAAFNKR